MGALATQGGPKIDKNGSRDPFWTRVGSKIDMGRPRSAPWGAKVSLKLPQRGSQNGIEKVIEKESQNESFCDAKITKSNVRYCKFLVSRGSEKYQTIIKNGSQNGTQKSSKWSPWRPKGRQGATLPPPGSIVRGPKNGSIFEGSLGRKKVDGC